MNAFRFKVSLRFFGPSFDPVNLSAVLGMKPARAWKAGERRLTPTGRELEGLYVESYCTFNIERNGSEEELHAILERVYVSLEKHREMFHQLRTDGGRIEIFIGWFSVGNTGATFSSELMRKLGDLGIDLALDIYGSDLPSATDQ